MPSGIVGASATYLGCEVLRKTVSKHELTCRMMALLRSKVCRDFDDGAAILRTDKSATEFIGLDVRSPKPINGLLWIPTRNSEPGRKRPSSQRLRRSSVAAIEKRISF